MNEKSLSPIIKNLMPSLTERGKIKIGRRGELRQTENNKQFNLPTKLNHFLITTMQRGADMNFLKDEVLHKKFGATPHEIPIMLIYDNIALNFRCSYARYKGRTLICRGDGERAYQLTNDNTRQMRECPCEKADSKYAETDKCKKNGSISCIIQDAPRVGGVWRFRTTSHNSCTGILSSLILIKRIAGGALAGIPLKLVIAPKTVTNPITQKLQTVYIVFIEFAGTFKELRQEGFKQLLEAKTHDMKVQNIEKEASKLLAYEPAEVIDDIKDPEFVDEFHPEQAAEAEGAEITDQEESEPPLSEPESAPPPEKPPEPPKKETAQKKRTRRTKPKEEKPKNEPPPKVDPPPEPDPEPEQDDDHNQPDLINPGQGEDSADVF